MTESARRGHLLIILATTAMGVLTFSLITPALPDLAAELGVSRGTIGLVQGAVAIPGVFLAIGIGYLADRLGRRFVIEASLLVFGVAGLASFFARSLWPLVGLRAIQGIGTSGLLSLGVVIIGDLYEGTERRRALGINSASITVTAMLSPTVGGILAQGGAFRPFLLYAIALPLMAWAWLLPGRPDGQPSAPPFAHVRRMFRALRRGDHFADFLGVLPFSVIMMVVFAGFAFTTTPLFLENEYGIQAAQRGLIQSTASVGSTITSLAAGWLAARFTGRRILTVSMGGIVAGFLLLAASPSAVGVIPGLFVLGIGIGAMFPLFQDLAATAAPGEFRGALVGTWVSTIRIGQAIGPILASSLAVGIGERTSYLAAAVVMAAITIVWRPLREWAGEWVARPEPDYRPIA